MLTVLDLSNIDKFLQNQESIINQPERNKEILSELRHKIAKELNKIQIKTEANK